MRYEESRLQAACVRWFRLQYPRHILYAIPNGGARNKITGKILKDEGVLAGVPDLFLMSSNDKGAHGLYIEMKTRDGVLSPAQKEFCAAAMLAGYACVVARSLEEFIMWVNKYLDGYSDKDALAAKI
jgi:hypothetical protein